MVIFCQNIFIRRIIMRNIYRAILKYFFRTRFITFRNSTNYTHAELSEQLEMDERSFSYLIHGQTSGSALTLALFLIYFCPDSKEFLDDLRKEFENTNDNIA